MSRGNIAPGTPPEQAVLDLLPLLGERSAVIHGSGRFDPAGGGDIDLAVERVDGQWPLRLREPWRFCQRLDHDVTGSYWILDREGYIVALDTLDDPDGRGKYRFPTDAVFGDEKTLSEAARAAYLTVKRLRKRSWDLEQWEAIQVLARSDPADYVSMLIAVVGRSAAQAVAAEVLAGRVPGAAVRRRWRRALRLRDLARPGRLIRTKSLQIPRVWRRLRWPTGYVVLVVGPDGVGKSSLVEPLVDVCAGFFRKTQRQHWRPGILPRPGRLVRREPRNPTAPHAATPYGRALSLVLLLYYWLDFLIGSWLKTWPYKVRSGLLVVERGWWDLAVDPRRYRLAVSTSLVRALGRLLPRPDLVLRLEVSPTIALERKSELTEAEVKRQITTWGTLAPGRANVAIDASRPRDEVVEGARAKVVAQLEARAMQRLGAGWLHLPSSKNIRWLLPRGPRRTAASALCLYHPVTPRALAGWQLARYVAAIGGARVLPRGEAPPAEVRRLIAGYLLPRSTIAVARSNHRDRFLVLVLKESGEPASIIKVALDAPGRDALHREAEALRVVARHLSPPLVAPRLLDAATGVLVQEFLPWRPRLRPWVIPPEVVGSLGRLYRKLGGDANGGPAHGDFAPWNLLRTEEGWSLVDWENWTETAPPFADLSHYVSQSVRLLGRPGWFTRRATLAPSGVLMQAVNAYAEAAGLDPAGVAVVRDWLEVEGGA